MRGRSRDDWTGLSGTRIESARLGSARLGSARLALALDSTRLGSARLGSTRLGLGWDWAADMACPPRPPRATMQGTARARCVPDMDDLLFSVRSRSGPWPLFGRGQSGQRGPEVVGGATVARARASPAALCWRCGACVRDRVWRLVHTESEAWAAGKRERERHVSPVGYYYRLETSTVVVYSQSVRRGNRTRIEY